MPAPRRNDPLGVSDNPRVVTDPARVEELTVEFVRRLDFVQRSYGFALRTLGSDREFNASLAKLKRSLARKRPAKRRGDRAHPEIETVISKFARDHARERTGDTDATVTQRDAQAGARRAAEILRARPGRSRHSILRHFVEGMMAVIQGATGRPVQLLVYKNSVYDPQAADAGGRVLVSVFEDLDAGITVGTLATIVKMARQKYAGKPMRFSEYFPLYGATGDPLSGTTELKFGYRLVGFEPNIPIYFP